MLIIKLHIYGALTTLRWQYTMHWYDPDANQSMEEGLLNQSDDICDPVTGYAPCVRTLCVLRERQKLVKEAL